MAAPLLNRNSVVLVKVESNYGVDSTPVVGTDPILCTVPQLSMDAQVLDRTIAVGYLSPNAPVIGRKLMNCSLGVEFKSQAAALDGVNSNPIALDDLLRASGWSPTYTVETVPPSSNDGYVIYAPISDSIPSASVYVYTGKEVLHKMLGSYVDWTIDMAAGGYAMMNCSIKGLYSAPTDTTAGAVTTESDVPVPIESLSLAFGAVTGQVVRNLSISANNEIVERADVNSADGFKGIRLVGRKPTIKFKMEKPLVATWSPYNVMDIGTQYNTTFTIGSTAGQKILVTAPKFTLTSVRESDDAGIVCLDIEGTCARSGSSGNDELTFKFF